MLFPLFILIYAKRPKSLRKYFQPSVVSTKRDKSKKGFFQEIASCLMSSSLSVTLDTPKARIINAIKKDKEIYYLSCSTQCEEFLYD